MLKELYVKYNDGRVEKSIISVKEGDQVKIYPIQDGIVVAGCKPFKYIVRKHSYLSTSICKFPTKYMIMPQGIECHPDTRLSDIIYEEAIVKPPVEIIKKEEPKTWKFESSSGGGTYIVKMTPKGLTCDCSGFWRVKDKVKGCVHCQKVRAGMLEN
jgi:hypothetical protein